MNHDKKIAELLAAVKVAKQEKADAEVRKKEEAQKKQALPGPRAAIKTVNHAMVEGDSLELPFTTAGKNMDLRLRNAPPRTTPEINKEFRRVLRSRDAYTALGNDGLNGLADFWGISRPAEWKAAAFKKVTQSLQSLNGTKKNATVNAIGILQGVYDSLKEASQ